MGHKAVIKCTVGYQLYHNRTPRQILMHLDTLNMTVRQLL